MLPLRPSQALSAALGRCLCAIAVLGVVPGALAAPQGTTSRVSVDSAGIEGNDDSGTFWGISLSVDGRYAAFVSAATNLVPADTNGEWDVFVHDRQTGQTERVSVDSAGVEGNHYSGGPRISTDGRWVAFSSIATNLVPGDTNVQADAFVHDRLTGTTERVSVDSSGGQGDGQSGPSSISPDGRWVAFGSRATNLIRGDTNYAADAFVHDRLTGVTTRVSVDSSGTQGNQDSQAGSISADGRLVAFASFADNLVPGDTNGRADVFVHDRLTGQTSRVSVDSAGAQADHASSFPSITPDGRYVVFDSGATNLVPGDTNGHTDIFVHDLWSGETTLVSTDSAGLQANAACNLPAISADGRLVVFESTATNLVPGDVNNHQDVFVHDRLTGRTTLVSVDSAGWQATDSCEYPALSPDGRLVAFTSWSSNLVPGDSNTRWDVFVHDREDTTPVVYCTAKVNSLGCTPAISATGTASASHATSFHVLCAQVVSSSPGMLIYGLSGPAASPFQGGWLCLGSPVKRTALQSSGGSPPPKDCSGSFDLDFNGFIASAKDPALVAGQEVWSQYWYRDQASPSGTGLSDGLDFLIGP